MSRSSTRSNVPRGTAGEWSSAGQLQHRWDWRAAGNFIGGGTGAGLWLAALANASSPTVFRVQAGLALVAIATGLLCVMAKTGRPARALNLFRHVAGSWMSREGFTLPTLFGCGLIALWQGRAGAMAVIAAVSALLFLYCQARILRAAHGIPAWSVAGIVPLLLSSGLAEGIGVASLAGLVVPGTSTSILAELLAGALALRLLAWIRYRGDLGRAVAPQESLDVLQAIAQRFVLGGHVAPLCLALGALASAGQASAVSLAVGGLLAAGSGWWLKLVLITRAGFFRRKSVSLAGAIGRRRAA
jgi:phenylacetyl-CoA:acceptor oxidoreductase subunit 2